MSHKKDNHLKSHLFDIIQNNAHLIVLILVVALVIMIVNATFGVNHNMINNESNAIFENDWLCSIDDKPFYAVTLPVSQTESIDNHITLKNKLPDKVIKGSTLLLRTSQQNVLVSVENTEIYNSATTNGISQSPSAAYHFIRLPNDSAGKDIAVTLDSPYIRYAGLLNQIHIGSKASNIFFLIQENGLRFALGALIFCIGLLTTVIFLFAKGKRNRHSIIYLGAFLACAGYWLTVESTLLQFIIPYPMLLTNTSIFALTLLPIFVALYYYKTHVDTFKTFGKIIIGVMSTFSFLAAIANLIDPALPLSILPIYLVLIGAYLLTLFMFILIENIKSKEGFSLSTAALLVIGLFSLGELIYYFSNMKNYNNSDLLTIGLVLFCAMLIIDSVGHFSKINKTAQKINNLTVLAYKDSLTSLKNRTAFIEKMDSLDPHAQNYISLGMFDVNDLKYVNDTFGHLAGDDMLIHSANILKSCMREEDDIYRIGGDEFAVILCTQNPLNLERIEDRLLSILIKENKKQQLYTLSIAYGYATYSSDIDKDLYETLKRADATMYACKRLQKAKAD